MNKMKLKYSELDIILVSFIAAHFSRIGIANIQIVDVVVILAMTVAVRILRDLFWERN